MSLLILSIFSLGVGLVLDVSKLKPETKEALKTVYAAKKETVEYMRQFGSPLEKAIADMILSASRSGTQ